MSNILEIRDLRVSFGGIRAVDGISFDVEEGKIVTLIGANGAGKSTILRSIAGITKPQSGKIVFSGSDITGQSPDRIVSQGVTLVPEGRRVFSNLTVLENLRIGAYLRRDSIADDIAYVYSLFPRLKERSWQLAGTLSGGELQRVLLALALEPMPNMLILDEPLSGVDVEGMELLMDMLDEIRKTYDLSILMTTHDFSMLGRYADRVVLLREKILCKGTPLEVLNSDEFAQAFHLGGAK